MPTIYDLKRVENCPSNDDRVCRSKYSGTPIANLAAAVAAEPLLSFLVQGEDAPRVGLKHLALLGQPKPTHIAHDET